MYVDRDSFNAHRAAQGRGGCCLFSVGWVKKHAVGPPGTPRAHPPSRGRRPPRHTSPQGVQSQAPRTPDPTRGGSGGSQHRDSFNAHRAAPGRGCCCFFSVEWVKKHAVQPPGTPRAHPPSRGRRPPRHTSPQGVQPQAPGTPDPTRGGSGGSQHCMGR